MSRVLVVDDHALMRDGLRAVLEAAGHEVVGEAAGVDEACGLAVKLQPRIVLLDLQLGERSGLELMAEVARRALSCRVIVMTMSSQPRHVALALKANAAGYVLKGSPGRELLRAIDVVDAGGRHLSGGAADLAMRAMAEAEGSSRSSSLSARERQVLVMVARGASSSAIGQQLHLSPKTVDSYRSRLMAKLELADVPALVRWAIREGLVGLEEP
jgi:DNA-binding NarL/FixJ family response regulator